MKPMPPCSSVQTRVDAVVEIGEVRLGERRVALGSVVDVVERVRGVPPERQRRLDVGDDVGELVLHRLEGADRLAELLARERVARRHVDAAARAAVRVGGEQHEAGVARAVDRARGRARS